MHNRVPQIVTILSFIFALLSIFTSYFWEIIASLIVLNLIFILFWHEDHPPIILAGLLMAWISISIGVYYCAITGQEIRTLLWRPFYSLENINKAFWLSIIGLSSLAAGVKIGAGRALKTKIDYHKVKQLDVLKLMITFIIYVPLTDYLFHKIRFIVPGISEFFHMLKVFRWSIFFLIVVAVFNTQRYKTLFWLLFTYGVILGFASFFSNFKDYFFIFPIAYLTVKKLTTRQIVVLTIATIFVFIIGVYWSYIKQDYRFFLSGGRKAQVVVVSKREALKKFFSYAKYFDKQRFQLGQEALIKRLFYLEYFSATIRYIPTYRPFMNGYNTMRAIKHVTMPRFLFPNKPPLDDSKHTIQLTGIYVATGKQGTSISTGYMAEFYADYGSFSMHIAVFVLGLLIGWMYRLFITNSLDYLIGLALAVPLFFPLSSFGKDLTKLVGDLVWLLITYLIIRYTILKYVIKFFYKKTSD